MSDEWKVEELTEDDIRDLEAGMPSCQDSEESGFGDDEGESETSEE